MLIQKKKKRKKERKEAKRGALILFCPIYLGNEQD